MEYNVYVCSVCGYTYDEAKGIPEAGIAPGTKWNDLPTQWVCPWCGAVKADFKLKAADQQAADIKELLADKQVSDLEMSILCSNLARGCEKQYLPEEAKLFFECLIISKQKQQFRSKPMPHNCCSWQKKIWKKACRLPTPLQKRKKTAVHCGH